MFPVLLSFLTAFAVVLFITPSLIKIAELKSLYDEPGDKRKLHHSNIPLTGGVIIFAALLFSYALWIPTRKIFGEAFIPSEFKYLIATVIVLFFIGLKDDIIGTAPVKKLIGHIIVGLILVLMADVRIRSMHGIFGVEELPEWAGIFISLFTYIVIINAFNLVDGVDGLAGGIGFIASLAFGCWFYLAGAVALAALALTLSGALLAFLVYNFYPARIFLGDSGSLTIGLVISYLAIKLIELPPEGLTGVLFSVSKPVFALAVLSYPLYDTLRIFINRTVKGNSPFYPDSKHVHHRLLKIGLTQRHTALILYAVNTLIILLALATTKIECTWALLFVGATTILIAQIPFWFKKKYDILPERVEAFREDEEGFSIGIKKKATG